MSIDAHDVARMRTKPGASQTSAARSSAPTNLRRTRHPDHRQHHRQPVDRRLRGASRPFFESLGFKSCTFSYPLTNLGSSYLSFSDIGLVNYRVDELIEVFEQIQP
jgi:hypothetical protein